ncbi:uncharacterized protein HMPREF1541_07559 [Cyphellophora europaea CBS 101466]|uniref:Uncharacterized protein n=1 Tax=Cyphellophora europaea (strain CBS 101466) TaxID=1220924 RepID=W2RN66_CYPE1|nr:uncharacterized protein HMPREF1541_07559 [Cyphellophora europaea CBS 101466]ETN37936.1 hypothetical protein HMPREF1541_07559 [Cyphellophora europaea CBS 101466]
MSTTYPPQPPTTLSLPHILSLRWTSTTQIHPQSIIAYNLSLGAPATHLAHVYERHPSFAPLPTFASTFAIALMSLVHADMPTFLPNFQAHNHLHAAHALRLHRPLPHTGTLRHDAHVLDVRPARNNGVQLRVRITTTAADDGSQLVLCEQEWTSIVLHVPTTGLPPSSSSLSSSESAAAAPPSSHSPPPPDRAPDAVHTHATSVAQAALYRAASNDLNPLHIDPATAARAGFPRPLLTGTCTFGVGVRGVVETVGRGRAVREVQGRLRRPVFAGDVVRTEMWEGVDRGVGGDGGDRAAAVVFRMVVREEGGGGRVVVDRGQVVFGEGVAEGGRARL